MFRVGEFSRICHVSVKTLHHYDRIGLLKPETVDPSSGYRYYSSAQVDQMLYIQRLKRYRFSLERIREILDCPDRKEVYSRLCEQKENLEREQDERDLVLRELRSHLLVMERTGELMTYRKDHIVEVKHSPELHVLACRRKMGVEEFGTHYSTIFERMAREKIAHGGLTGARYYDESFDHDCSDIELFATVEKEAADKTIASTLCAHTVHRGAYSTLSEAYGAIVSWIEANGYRYAGAPYELYVKTQFDGLDPTDWETEIYFPIEARAV